MYFELSKKILFFFLFISLHCDGQFVLKSINIKNRNYSKIINISFINHKFAQKDSFNNRFFSKSFFKSDTFKLAYFANSVFPFEAYFKNNVFNGETDFTNCLFLKNTDFGNSIFYKNASFLNDTFLSKVIFDYVFFPSNVSFNSSNFFKNVTFNHSVFSQELNFKNSIFYCDLLDFSYCAFLDSVRINFAESSLPMHLNFSNINIIKNEIDLLNSNFIDFVDPNIDIKFSSKPDSIYLYRSDISKFHLDYIHYKLWLPNFTTEHPSTKISNDEKEAIYEELLNNFKVRGQLESYKLLDIEYQKFKWKNSWAPFLVFIPKYWWNFGYDKEYIFLWVVVFILIFTLVSYFFLEYLNSIYEFYTEENKHQIPNFSFKRFTINDSLKRTWYSFMFSTTVFFMLSLNLEKIKFFKFWGTFLLIIMYSLGIICLAYMANFILQK